MTCPSKNCPRLITLTNYSFYQLTTVTGIANQWHNKDKKRGSTSNAVKNASFLRSAVRIRTPCAAAGYTHRVILPSTGAPAGCTYRVIPPLWVTLLDTPIELSSPLWVTLLDTPIELSFPLWVTLLDTPIELSSPLFPLSLAKALPCFCVFISLITVGCTIESIVYSSSDGNNFNFSFVSEVVYFNLVKTYQQLIGYISLGVCCVVIVTGYMCSLGHTNIRHAWCIYTLYLHRLVD